MAASSSARRPIVTLELTPLRLALAILGLVALAVVPAVIVGLLVSGNESESAADGGPTAASPVKLTAVPGSTTSLKLADGSSVRVTLVNIWNEVQPNMAVRVDGPAAAKLGSAWTVVLSNGTAIALAEGDGDSPDTRRLFVDRPIAQGLTWTAIRYAPEGAAAPVVFSRP